MAGAGVCEEAKGVGNEKKITEKRWDGDLRPHTVHLRPALGTWHSRETCSQQQEFA